MSQFAKNDNVFFELFTDKCLVKPQATSDILLHGSLRSDGPYYFCSLQATMGLIAIINSITNGSSNNLQMFTNNNFAPIGPSL